MATISQDEVVLDFVSKGSDKLLQELRDTQKETDKTKSKLEGLSKSSKDAGKGFNTVEDAAKSFGEQLSRRVTDSLGAFGDVLSDVNDQFNITPTVARAVRGALRGVVNAFGTLARLTGVVSPNLTALNLTFSRLPGSVKAVTVAFRAFRIALISTGIGAIVVALGSLIAALSTSREITDRVRVIFAQFGAVVRVIVTRARNLGKELLSLQNPLRAFRNFFDGLFSEAKQAAEEIGEVEKALQSLADQRKIIEQAVSAAEAELSALIQVIRDAENETSAAREAAAKRALELVGSTFQQQIGIELQQLELLRQRLRTIDTDDVGREAAEDAIREQIALINSLTSANERREQRIKSAQRGITTATKEETDELRPLVELYQELDRVVEQLNEKRRTGNLEGVKGLQEQQKEIEKLIQATVDFLRISVPENFDFLPNTDIANQAIESLEPVDPARTAEVLGFREDLTEELEPAVQSAVDKLQKEINEIEFQRASDNVRQFTSSVVESISTVVDRQIAETDRLINAQNERVQRASEIAERGNAEILQSEREKLRKLTEERERFVQRQRQLAAIQFSIESALSIAGAVRAISNATNPVQIALQVAAIVGGITAVVSSIQNAFSSVPSFWEGTLGDKTISEQLGAPNYSRGRDGYLVRVDGSERVLPGHISSQLRGIPTEALPRLLNSVQAPVVNMSPSFDKSQFRKLHGEMQSQTTILKQMVRPRRTRSYNKRVLYR